MADQFSGALRGSPKLNTTLRAGFIPGSHVATLKKWTRKGEDDFPKRGKLPLPLLERKGSTFYPKMDFNVNTSLLQI